MFWRLGFWKKDKEAHMNINNDNNKEVNNKKNISDNKEMNQPEFKEINSDNAYINKDVYQAEVKNNTSADEVKSNVLVGEINGSALFGDIKSNASGADVPKPYFANRELSWLKFNERVIDEAADLKVPLCERLTFVSIFNSNLDEFYMVRVGSLYDQMLLAKGNKHDKNAGFDNKTLMTAREQLDAVFSETRELLHKKDKIYQQLMYRFEEQGVKLISFNDVEYSDAVYLEEYFNNSILPILSPQVISKKNPFPFLKNKEIYAVALLGSKNNDKIGVVPCSNGVFDRLIPIP